MDAIKPIQIDTFLPRAAVWEITMACNMRCGHCGSSCAERLPDELTPEEALRLCDDLAQLGLRLITLSGGEPLLRKDWPAIAGRFTDQGVGVNMISNGWLVNDETIDRAAAAGLESIALSLDGVEETHDRIRKPGAFAKALSALEKMQSRGFSSSVVTTVMKPNLTELPELKRLLEGKGVERWQLQIGMPMGNLQNDVENVIDPAQALDIIDFAYDLLQEGRIKPYLADCVGYYTKKSAEIRKACGGKGARWSGCQAGKQVVGILHNGRIVGCTSMRDERYVEGSIRDTPLREIWTRPGAFSWNRDLCRDMLKGFCRKCQFGERCLGGCSTMKLTMAGGIAENTYCAYRTMVRGLLPKIDRIQDVGTLMKRAETAAGLKLYEVAEICQSRALEMAPEKIDALKALGYVCFKLGITKGVGTSMPKHWRSTRMTPMPSKAWVSALSRLDEKRRASNCWKRRLPSLPGITWTPTTTWLSCYPRASSISRRYRCWSGAEEGPRHSKRNPKSFINT
ncbi:hypothetical protein D3OALGB2SA_2510 [Olavius algarvensis associated proteobacterium Delta 3]|nr:hypothetical protein D3OALGB2SA_2510 [Olavius algarvensis associated proteobacterium Delta 3]